MKVIILAAGVGSRLGKSAPKSLTKLVDGKSILQHQIEGLTKYIDYKNINIIVGYKKNMIIDHFPKLSYFYNSNYKYTNTAKSLLIGLNELQDHNILWINGDVVFDHRIIKKMIDRNYSCMAVNKSKVGTEEVKYKTNSKGDIMEVSKNVVNSEGESVGINKIISEDSKILRKYLQECKDDAYFEKGIELAIIQNDLKVRSVDITKFMCMEIDFISDLKLINKEIIKYNN
tara:strand:+ start:2715 stop:3404 length:690 start_codon:yes stop_codon:yes gene_type:complete